MKRLLTTVLAMSVLAITLSAHAAVKSHSGSIIVDQPGDLPDVTDPAQIRAVSQIALDASALYDFVRGLGDSAALIRYRNNSSVAVLSLKRYKHPVLSSAPALANASTYECLEPTALLVESPRTLQQPESPSASYDIVDLSPRGNPAVLASFNDVRQTLVLRNTGTLFLLNDHRLTVVRQPQVELEHATEFVEMNHN